MTDDETTEEVTKRTYRRRIWNELQKNDLLNPPRGPRRKWRMPTIPDFKGSEEAAKRLSELPEFKSAKIIKLNHDPAQAPLRVMALEAGKDIIMPIRQLKEGLFLQLTSSGDPEEDAKNVASRKQMLKLGKHIGVEDNVKVDLVVMGAVCVSRQGLIIGKGTSFADLEFAILMKMGAVNQDTIVVATVHDCQVVDYIPTDLWEKHDVSADIIVTPTQVISITGKVKKPGIFWDLLNSFRVSRIPSLQKLKELDEKEGEEVVLKPDESWDKWQKKPNKRQLKQLKKQKSKSNSDDNKETPKDREEKEEDKSRVRRKRRTRTRTRQDKTESPEDEDGKTTENSPEKSTEKSEKRRRPQPRYRSKSDIAFSLKLSNIGPFVRIRDVKNALVTRGVRPTDITWRGRLGFCLLHFGKLRNDKSEANEPVQVDSIVANLQQLRIGEPPKGSEIEFIVVEPAEPITRIEITDVTAV